MEIATRPSSRPSPAIASIALLDQVYEDLLDLDAIAADFFGDLGFARQPDAILGRQRAHEQASAPARISAVPDYAVARRRRGG